MHKNIYVQISAVFGLLGAILIVLYFFCFYWLGKNPLLYMSTFDLVIPVICMTLAMFYFRDRKRAGSMHFWEGLIIGFFTNFIATFLSALVIYLFIVFIDTGLLTKHIADLQDLIVQSKEQINTQFGKDAFEQTVQKISQTSASDVGIDLFIKKFLICLFASGFVAAVLRKNQ
ncbi:DUF4199 domain-containing protein [Rhodocytophaga aerolata]|uniref:DUF4199 domain-containing protein n=1 Tax=Rhodocytophaga aerolata TaxID=455078 RepID=A0ABT8R3W9_9BACT|nr:DUF4199 domain-containing protein [Rhodocytophaga aerolata]MDO1446778.1 DUF4199 domain-containing protein [Rhodocytophaga aerolata]